jgi:hypothetical protein
LRDNIKFCHGFFSFGVCCFVLMSGLGSVFYVNIAL